MSGVQLALNVSDVSQAVEFYSKLFGTAPAKLRPGYANFAIAEPPLKLVLIENVSQAPGSLNHLGVEVGSTQEVQAAKDRLERTGLLGATEDQVECCDALQDKVWAHGPGGEEWECYTVLADAAMAGTEMVGTEMAHSGLRRGEPSGAACCGSRPDLTQPDPN